MDAINNDRWSDMFKKTGALWIHDGHSERPYALLTSGKISDVFFNCSKLIEQPNVLEQVADELISATRRAMLPDRFYPDAVVGPATGAITLAYTIARKIIDSRAWYTEPEGEGKTKTMVLKRFEPYKQGMTVFAVEDVITTGASTDTSASAALEVDPTIDVFDYVACIVNRSGFETTPMGRKIISLLSIKAQVWERGKNPFTPDGAEFVEPVRPKANWHALTRAY